jgi:hypothetical protein
VEDLGDGVTRQILGYDTALMLVRVGFRQGAKGYPHHHPHRQVTYVEKGSFDVTIDGQKTVLKAGEITKRIADPAIAIVPLPATRPAAKPSPIRAAACKGCSGVRHRTGDVRQRLHTLRMALRRRASGGRFPPRLRPFPVGGRRTLVATWRASPPPGAPMPENSGLR